MTLQEKIKAMDEALKDLISCAYDSEHLSEFKVKIKERRIIVKDAKTAWEELKAELGKPYTLNVDIPETVNDLCNFDCPLLTSDIGGNTCNHYLDEPVDAGNGGYACKPAKGCPRYKSDNK